MVRFLGWRVIQSSRPSADSVRKASCSSARISRFSKASRSSLVQSLSSKRREFYSLAPTASLFSETSGTLAEPLSCRLFALFGQFASKTQRPGACVSSPYIPRHGLVFGCNGVSACGKVCVHEFFHRRSDAFRTCNACFIPNATKYNLISNNDPPSRIRHHSCWSMRLLSYRLSPRSQSPHSQSSRSQSSRS
jgi:hypothetical protein